MKTMVAVLLALLTSGVSSQAQNWPSFRGERAGGVADDQHLPTTWNVATGENIRWRTPLPGMSHASPVVWGPLVFVITAAAKDGPSALVLGDKGGIGLAEDSDSFTWTIYALDRATGEIVWSRAPYVGEPRARRHVKSSQANSTPATDGERVVAIFGSQGLAAFDMEGNLLWQKDLGVLDAGLFGDPSSNWGHASSPILHEGKVIVQVDRHGDSYVAAFDAGSGESLWKISRDEKPVWATPTLVTTASRTELVVVGGDFDRGLDPATGKELWRFPRDYQVKTPTPIAAGDLIVLAGGYRGKPVYALRQGGVGEIGAAWTSGPGGPYTSTPIVYDQRLYFVRDTGILTSMSLADGASIYRERLDSTFSASPVASDGKLYFVGEDGAVFVVQAGAEFRLLARNDMGEPSMASPAISHGTLFVRTQSALYAIAQDAEPAAAGGTD